MIRRYNDSYSGNTDSQIVRLISEIKQLEEEEEKITARIAELGNLEELAQDECEKLKARIEKAMTVNNYHNKERPSCTNLKHLMLVERKNFHFY